MAFSVCCSQGVSDIKLMIELSEISWNPHSISTRTLSQKAVTGIHMPNVEKGVLHASERMVSGQGDGVFDNFVSSCHFGAMCFLWVSLVVAQHSLAALSLVFPAGFQQGSFFTPPTAAPPGDARDCHHPRSLIQKLLPCSPPAWVRQLRAHLSTQEEPLRTTGGIFVLLKNLPSAKRDSQTQSDVWL